MLELTLNNPLDPADMIVTGSVFANNFSKMNIEQTKIAGTYDFDTTFVENIDFGVQLTEVNNRSAGSVVQRERLGRRDAAREQSQIFSPPPTPDQPSTRSPAAKTRGAKPFYTFNMGELIARTEALMASGDATTFMLADMGDCGTGLCTSQPLQRGPSHHRRIHGRLCAGSLRHRVGLSAHRYAAWPCATRAQTSLRKHCRRLSRPSTGSPATN